MTGDPDSGSFDTALRGLAREVPPPPDLRDAVVDHLAETGRLRSPAAGGPLGGLRGGPGWMLAAVAVIVAFLVGRASVDPDSSLTGAAPVVAAGEEDLGGRENWWALLLYEDGEYDPGGRSMEALDSVYLDWAAEGRAAGIVDQAAKFSPTEHLVDGGSSVSRPAGAAPPPGILTGLFLVHASSPDAAIAVARTTPHLEMGGRIVARFIDPM